MQTLQCIWSRDFSSGSKRKKKQQEVHFIAKGKPGEEKLMRNENQCLIFTVQKTENFKAKQFPYTTR